MTVVIGRTHRPCGACVALVPVAVPCRHTRPTRPRRRAAKRELVATDRTALLAALGYPKP